MVAIIPLVLVAIQAIAAIIGGAIDTGKAVLDTILHFFQAAFTLLQSFIQSAPMPMKIIIFLFFILSIGNVLSNFLFSTRFACDSDGILYQTDQIGTAMTLMLKNQFQDMNAIQRNNYVQSNFEPVTQRHSQTNIKCVETTPRLYFYSIDILSYNLWILILLIGFGTPLVWGYYSKMGVLH